MKFVIILINIFCILWIFLGYLVCELECLVMYVFIYLFDGLEKMDMSIYYLYIYWLK